VGTTALTPFFAIPHIIVQGEAPFHLIAIRCRKGVVFTEEKPAIQAVFFLIGTKDNRTLHLKVLSALAQIVQSSEFEKTWLSARDPKHLKSLMLSAHRGRFH